MDEIFSVKPFATSEQKKAGRLTPQQVFLCWQMIDGRRCLTILQWSWWWGRLNVQNGHRKNKARKNGKMRLNTNEATKIVQVTRENGRLRKQMFHSTGLQRDIFLRRLEYRRKLFLKPREPQKSETENKQLARQNTHIP